MKKLTFTCYILLGFLVCAVSTNRAQDKPIFDDKKLEAAVRKHVFEKRDNDKPLTESDVANLSTIQASGYGITNLAGLEKCVALASLDLASNKVSDLSVLQGMARLQYLNVAGNHLESVAPLGKVIALQYIELSRNRVRDITPLAALTNLASLYLSGNQVVGAQETSQAATTSGA